MLRVDRGAAPRVAAQVRHRFYKPLTGAGVAEWRQHQGQLHRPPMLWRYDAKPMDPKPIPEASNNNYFGRSRVWNAIPSRVGILAAKAEQWGWPHRDPPPKGLRRSHEFFPHWFARYFPDVDCRMKLDSVLNNETTTPTFYFPPTLSRLEIANYLRNVHGFDNIQAVSTRNRAGRGYKNEIGALKRHEDVKVATVVLETPVLIELKQVKETSDDGDNRNDA